MSSLSTFNSLIHDHRRITDLFEQLQQSDEPGCRRVLFQQIKAEIRTHTVLEEAVLYPRLKQYDQLSDFVESSYDEHQEMKDIIHEIDEIETESTEMDPIQISELRDELESAIEELIDLVSYHVEEEEERLFPQIAELLSIPELDKLEDALDLEVASRAA